MRVKIGDEWHEAEPGKAIMLELTDSDKRNISQMHPEASKYAIFHEADERTTDQKLEWME